MERIHVRTFRLSDIPDLVQILKANGQYDYPEVEGPAAMERVAQCDATVFLVAELGGKPCGLVKAVYDGSRALVHLLSVHPGYQHSGVGSALVDAVSAELARRGAPSVSVTVTERSERFWEEKGFERLPVFLMLRMLK
jgi:N-acetylglutamate synthase-like GNAT family acetyltransferase